MEQWMPANLPWLIVAVGLLVLGFFGYRDWRANGFQAALRRFGRLGLMVADRAVNLTPTEKDNMARDFVKARLRAAGYSVDGTLEDELKALLPALWQEYKVDDLGIPAHVDGKLGKAAISAAITTAAEGGAVPPGGA